MRGDIATGASEAASRIYKISLVVIAGVVSYWLDRSLFPHAPRFQSYDLGRDYADSALSFDLQPEPPNDLLFAVSMIRRALIVAAAMIAVGLGP